jgi:transmembrane sensor
MQDRETSSAIESEAVRWVARLDRGPLSAEDAERLSSWLAGDARRQGAFARAQAVMAFADRARALRRPDVDTSEAEKIVRTSSRRRWIGAAGAACAALMFTYFLLPRAETVATARGEVRTVALGDGSRATLDTASRFEVRFARSRRDVELLAGEALFDVAKDRDRPFVVKAGPVDAIAVGTSFSVAHDGRGGAIVTVREGKVEVRSRSGRLLRLLTANMEMHVAPSSAAVVNTLASEEVDRELAWRSGMIALDGDRLDDAVREFARYGGPRIIVEDPRLAEHTLSGWFAANDPRGFARAAALSIGARVRETDEGIFVE